MVQRTFYTLPGEAPPESGTPEPPPDDLHTLRFGYNMADLDRLTRLAAGRVFGGDFFIVDKYDLAWSAIAEALYAAADRPDPQDLVRTGQKAISAARMKDLGQHGLSTSGPAPRFAAYWTGLRATPSPETRIVERTALWQILPHLTEVQRAAVHALAVHGSYTAAAGALGIRYGAFVNQIHLARRRFFSLWLEGETPVRARVDRRVGRARPLPERCSAGHEFTPENTRIERRVRHGRLVTVRRCRECASEYMHSWRSGPVLDLGEAM